MIEIREITYQADIPLSGVLACETGQAPRPGVLVVHEGTGLGDHAVDSARRLAQMGYCAFAADLYGARDLPLDVAAQTVSALKADPELLLGRLRAGLAVLAGLGEADSARLAAMGFCFGGSSVLELARDGADLQAVICMHGELAPLRPTNGRPLRPRVLVCVGSEDAFVSPQARLAFEDEMRAAGARWDLRIYGGVRHSFTNPQADSWNLAPFAYDAAASEDAWDAAERTLRASF